MDKQREAAAEDPQVVFQPVMCQHCNNAPCETVCPVLATTHSTEGLNQMTYNRCIGTRYCANNCPYKVRRFNWFSYYASKERGFSIVNPAHEAIENEGLGKMVLNPDVTVRARGVMEKCSMCVQRIQSGKLAAKIESRRPVDGEIETACSQSCPADSIVFGDMNDPESRISKLLNDENKERAYHLLEEINVKPSVSYLTKIRNV
jgi:Fe-S-cluster-containing dehydrogenase component